MPAGVTMGSSGGTTALAVSSQNGCFWNARSDSPWITVSSAFVAEGATSVPYTVAENPGPVTRTGTIIAADRTFVVTQLGNAPGPYDGSWTGTTSQSRPIAFTIAANELTSLSLSLSATIGKCSLDGSFTAETSPRP